MSVSLYERAVDLLNDYSELIDSGKLEQWLDLFTDDARYEILPRENTELGLPLSLMLCVNKNMIRDRIVALREANEYNLHYDRHLVTNVQARPSDDGAISIRANFVVMQTSLEGQTRLFSTGRYTMTARDIAGDWRLANVRIVVDSFAVQTLLATPL